MLWLSLCAWKIEAKYFCQFSGLVLGILGRTFLFRNFSSSSPTKHDYFAICIHQTKLTPSNEILLKEKKYNKCHFCLSMFVSVLHHHIRTFGGERLGPNLFFNEKNTKNSVFEPFFSYLLPDKLPNSRKNSWKCCVWDFRLYIEYQFLFLGNFFHYFLFFSAAGKDPLILPLCPSGPPYGHP